MTDAIQGLEPQILWRNFAEITAIPRPSKHEERIVAHVLKRSRELGLEARQDAGGNIAVKKPATPGREQVPGICLQCHLDMVPEKNADKVHDFLSDPIELIRQGEFITANGTTLGADNGIGIATNLAVMEDRSLEHGPLELLFTRDEETGLNGAQQLDPSLVESRILLNLDSEDEGVLFVGCAGGRDSLGEWTADWESAPAASSAHLLSVKGLKGGHSGLEIDKGLGNAIKLLNRTLLELGRFGVRVGSIDGGNMRNAIPRECQAVIYLPPGQSEPARALVEKLSGIFRAELAATDPGLALTLSDHSGTVPTRVLTEAFQQRLTRVVSALPHGVLQMSADIPGLVETSTNLALIKTSETAVTLVTSQRSSVASRLEEAVQTVASAFELGGAQVETSDGYPGWKPNLASPILKTALQSYRDLFGQEAEVQAVHAGLECGIIGERYPGMDMISFGPTLEFVHSPDERIQIASVEKFWTFLKAMLRAAK